MTQQSSVANTLPLALSQGDPAGVGPQASLMAWEAFKDSTDTSFYVRGHVDTHKARADQFCPSSAIVQISDPSEAQSAFRHGLPIIDIPSFPVTAGTPDVSTGAAITNSIRLCVEDVWQGRAGGVTTNPISKSLLKSAGFKHPGHTEYLAELAGEFAGTDAPRPIMMLVGGGLRVALATIHVPLMSVGTLLKSALIEDVADIVLRALQKDFGLENARLGVAGLNPHAGEDGILGAEDGAIIAPAIHELNKAGNTVIGPRPGDTVFHEMLTGSYDAVLAMYHDQGLIPVKTLDIWGGVNVTLGLPFIRTSPDHGTAYDAAAKGAVKVDSLIAAMKLAKSMTVHRASWEAQNG